MKRAITMLAGLAALAASLPAAAQDTVAKVKQAGVIVVGVKQDYKPWGYLDPTGKIVGFEIDLANDVARRLGVKAELVPVTAVTRMEFLKNGRLDLVIATMGDTPDRRKVVGMVEPNYYAGATNVMAPKSAALKEWSDLKGKKVCAVQGAYYNRRVSQLYGPELVVFPAVPEAFSALQAGNCVAFLFDDTLFISTLSAGDPKWANFEMPLKSEDPQPWAIGIRLEDMEGPLGKLMKEISTEWHRKGTLIELEKKWGMKPSPFLQEMHDKLKGSS
jgi:polar amino acid transport system substrate-binding protein